MPAPAAWRRLFVALPVLLASVLAFTLVDTAPADAQLTKREQRERKIHRREVKIKHGVEVAIKQKGDPYRYGASGPGAFDCSGLTMYAFKKADLTLPRTSDGQARALRHIPRRHLERGDLIFFHHGGNVYHAAIYLKKRHGHRIILHAPYPGTRVRREAIWTNSWFAATLRKRSIHR
jgi:cell wall-associated NlpC family hydrolase